MTANIYWIAALLVFQYGDSDFSEELFEKAQRYARRILVDTKDDDYSEFIRAITIIYFVMSSNSKETLEFMHLLLQVTDQGKPSGI